VEGRLTGAPGTGGAGTGEAGTGGRESADYLTRQLITYIGNKRALLSPLGDAVATVRRRLGGRKLRVLDAFSGSGVVSRALKAHASELVANDIEGYARAISECYLSNRSAAPVAAAREAAAHLNAVVDHAPLAAGFVERLYAPRDEADITLADRVFYTRANARRLDNYRRLLDSYPPDVVALLLGPLLSEASVHANTAGVFKGFYKDRHTGIGKFGGSGADALGRIRGEIRLTAPVLSRFECAYRVHQLDANEVVRREGGFDLAYFDPPYNQHPYGSNYFMLNLLVDYAEPTEISRVSGIPTDWRRSDYNVRSKALARLAEMVETVDARFVLLSFNDDGHARPAELRAILEGVGRVEVVDHVYNTFRGSRNLRNRSLHVTEHLFLTEKY
jgi:adenine-specific DNA-methyltransferase